MADVVQEFLAGRIGIHEDGDQRTLEFLSFVENLGLKWVSGKKPTKHCFTSNDMYMKISDFGLKYGKMLCRDFKNSKTTSFALMTATEFLEGIDSLKSADFSDFGDMFGE